MAGNNVKSQVDDSPKREEFSDFALVPKDGSDLKCHKFMLAQVSPVFRAMLREDYEETRTNKMKVTEFESDTARSFLDFIYSYLKVAPVQSRCKKNFDEERLTPDLLRMSHMYEVRILEDKCVEHLQKSIVDTNVVDIWSLADSIGNDKLKKVALHHLGMKKKMMMDVPGLREALESPHLRENLLMYLSSRMTAREEEEINITLIVKYRGIFNIKVQLSDTVQTLRALMNVALIRKGHEEMIKGVGKFMFGSVRLEESRTIKSYGIAERSTLDYIEFEIIPEMI